MTEQIIFVKFIFLKYELFIYTTILKLAQE